MKLNKHFVERQCCPQYGSGNQRDRSSSLSDSVTVGKLLKLVYIYFSD